ncbi:hypothetical protein P7K49_016110 [Saguinus oedipus]|uniref:Uncharacterized protein n=1 Tax=Saguinus oedipus TaxID=9490 RepID=A0ABQ9VBP8_SAGOE|nr:hypothetical protein P7K49_016110 [Saguinus oedipus]
MQREAVQRESGILGKRTLGWPFQHLRARAPPRSGRNGVITQYSVAYVAVDGEDRGRHVVEGISREHSSWDLVGLEKWTEYRVWSSPVLAVPPGREGRRSASDTTP